MLHHYIRRPRRLIDSVKIAAPCNVPYEDMTGDERTRLCGSCQKNVYNISALSESEAEQLLKDNNGKKLCLSLYQRADGTIIFDNCPTGMKTIRQRLAKCAAVIALSIGLTWLAQKVQAQGLVGAPVDPRYGQSFEVGGLADYGYDAARDICNATSLLSVPVITLFGFASVRRAKKKALRWYRRGASSRIVKMLVRRKIWQSIAVALLLPILIYEIGSCVISNWASLGGFGGFCCGCL